MAYIDIKDVTKKYDNSDYFSVSDFNLEIEKGEFIVFVGPSGCGKSTTLRMVCGLEEITSGSVKIDGVEMNDVEVSDRDVAMVFQSYALYPHMTVKQNISFPLEMKKVPQKEIDEAVNKSAKILDLQDQLTAFPRDLSGGQRQRVALARAIVRGPKVFLMDEPLSNLDAKLRSSTRFEILKLHKDLAATIIYVTHDQVEAMTMGDRVVVMKDGIIQQVDTPMNLYYNPSNLFVATFIGQPKMNIFDVNIQNNELTFKDGPTIKIPQSKSIEHEGMVLAGIRPEHFSFLEIDKQGPNETVDLLVKSIEYMGNENYIYCDFVGMEIIIKSKNDLGIKVGEMNEVAIKVNKIHFFDKETEVCISNN